MTALAVAATAAPAAYLGVERSLTGRRWVRRLEDDAEAAAMAQRCGLPEALCRVLAGRGVGVDEAAGFLEPRLKTLLPEPDRLPDMPAAAERIADAVAGGEAIVVFGDYDVDGATGSALLLRFLRGLGAAPSFYVPDRVREGYGPSVEAVRRLHAAGARLMLTVDCGATAFAPLEEAARLGLDVVVLDHHQGEATLPPARAVVNPNRADADGPGRELAAVGVCFLAAIAVSRALRRRGWFAGRPEPDLLALLDLVALGTVADVVPLVGLNRAFVRQGLKVLARRGNPGLAALAEVARLHEPARCHHLGFVLGPRVNAGGRVGSADLGVRLLATDDPGEAGALALTLEELNRRRQAVEQEVVAAATPQVEAGGGPPPALILAVGEGWHAGVVGIVAARLAARYRRPAVVIGVGPDGVGKGSGRSVPGVDLGRMVRAARAEGLLLSGGGHAMAAGLAVAAGRIPALAERLRDAVAAALADAPARDLLSLDAALAANGLTPALYDELERAGPFGAGHARPRVAVPAVSVWQADIRNGGHVSLRARDGGGAGLAAVAFRAVGTPLGEALLGRAAGRRLHLAGHLACSTWNGQRRVELVLEDAAEAGRT